MKALVTMVLGMAAFTLCSAYQMLCFMLPWQSLQVERRAGLLLSSCLLHNRFKAQDPGQIETTASLRGAVAGSGQSQLASGPESGYSKPSQNKRTLVLSHSPICLLLFFYSGYFFHPILTLICPEYTALPEKDSLGGPSGKN